MNLLAIETSSALLSVAVKKGSSPVRQKKFSGFLQHAEKLMPAVDSLLRAEGIGIRDIDVFLLGRGPGSFTGLRIGFATVKGFLAVHKKECRGGLSLDMIAENVSPRKFRRLCVGMDAHRGMIYARFYKSAAGSWVPEGDAKVVSAADLAGLMIDGMAFAGDALAKYQDILSREAGISSLGKKDWYPKAASLIKWFEKEKRQNPPPPKLQCLSKPEDFIPLYFRLSEAEERTGQHAAAS